MQNLNDNISYTVIAYHTSLNAGSVCMTTTKKEQNIVHCIFDILTYIWYIDIFGIWLR